MADQSFTDTIHSMLDRYDDDQDHSNRYLFVEALRRDVLDTKTSVASRLAIVKFLTEQQEGRPGVAVLPPSMDVKARDDRLKQDFMRIYGATTTVEIAA